MDIRNAKLTDLTPEKRELVAKLLAKKRADQEQKKVLKPIAGDVFPVSFAQQAMLEYAFQNPSVCNLVISYEMEGQIDFQILEESFNTVVNRHKILRVSFFKKGETFFQRVKEKSHQRIIYHDLRSLKKTSTQHLHDYVVQESLFEFDLEKDLLFRMTVLKISEDKYFLINNIHHLLTDTWSNLLLASEFMKTYKNILERKNITVDEPAIHYTDYAYWEREWIESFEAKKQKVFWENYLAGAKPLCLDTDFPREENSISHRLLSEQFSVKPEIAAQFIKFCFASKVTIYTGVSAVLFALLYFYTKTNDICIGTYAVLRTKPETFSMIGYLVNDITFRATVTGAETPSDFLQYVGQLQSEAQNSRELPQEIVSNLLNPEDDRWLSSLQRVLCLFSQTEETLTAVANNSSTDENQGLFAETADLPWKVKLMPPPDKDEFTDRDLILSLYLNGQDIRLRLWYNSGLFNCSTVIKMLSRFETLFALFSNDDSSTLDQILEKI